MKPKTIRFGGVPEHFNLPVHLMAIVDASANDKKISKGQFSIIKNLDGALESLEDLASDVFYWEKFTTKPYVDSGRLRRIGEFVTPWP